MPIRFTSNYTNANTVHTHPRFYAPEFVHTNVGISVGRHIRGPSVLICTTLGLRPCAVRDKHLGYVYSPYAF